VQESRQESNYKYFNGVVVQDVHLTALSTHVKQKEFAVSHGKHYESFGIDPLPKKPKHFYLYKYI
jgi:hypothetical protein